ncbi:MAG: hypothetical protein ACLQSR_13000 [Limisphaerales bacterium]
MSGINEIINSGIQDSNIASFPIVISALQSLKLKFEHESFDFFFRWVRAFFISGGDKTLRSHNIWAGVIQPFMLFLALVFLSQQHGQRLRRLYFAAPIQLNFWLVS